MYSLTDELIVSNTLFTSSSGEKSGINIESVLPYTALNLVTIWFNISLPIAVIVAPINSFLRT